MILGEQVVAVTVTLPLEHGILAAYNISIFFFVCRLLLGRVGTVILPICCASSSQTPVVTRRVT
jgi:hypothetical protein